METRVSVSVIRRLQVNSISYVLTMFDYTRQIKCDKTTKIFSLDKVLFHISVPFSLQSDDT